MAHSIQTFAGKSDIFNDTDLLVVIGLALDIISESAAFEELRPLALEWERAIKEYGPGVLDLKLEHGLETPNQQRVFGDLMEEILSRCVEYKSRIPASTLNERISAPGVTFFDYDVAAVTAALEKLRHLTAKRTS